MLRRNEQSAGAAGTRLEREALVRHVASVIKASQRLKYFSVEIEGAEHLPKHGQVVYAQNHAGWFALDTIMLGYAVGEALDVSRTPYFAAQDAALAAPLVGPFLRRLGGLPASSFRNPERLPADIDSFGICPEGVRGNCKPFWEAYRMHEWSRTFVKLACVRGAPIIPVAVLGGEECLPVAWTVKVLEPLIGSTVGLPLVPVPLPSRWKIVFHPPVHVTENGPIARPERQYCADFARRVQDVVQDTIDRNAWRRPIAQLSSFVSTLKRPRAARPEVHGAGAAASPQR